MIILFLSACKIVKLFVAFMKKLDISHAIHVLSLWFCLMKVPWTWASGTTLWWSWNVWYGLWRLRSIWRLWWIWRRNGGVSVCRIMNINVLYSSTLCRCFRFHLVITIAAQAVHVWLVWSRFCFLSFDRFQFDFWKNRDLDVNVDFLLTSVYKLDNCTTLQYQNCLVHS